MGKAGPFPRLVFREEVMLSLDQFAHRHSAGEQGGFLVGRKRELKTAEQFELIVERFVPIPQKRDASRLVITQEHYTSVLRGLRSGDGGEEILGWAHTHPGFGVFLSSFDKEQHERFFPEPWQVAYIMDTQGHARGVYHLVEGEWKEIAGYYILRQMADNEIGITTREQSSPWLKLVTGILVLLLLIAGGMYGYTVISEMFLERSAAPTLSQEQDSSLGSESEYVIEIESVEDPSPPPPPVPTQTTIAPPTTVPRYVEYTVKSGDTLWSIAQTLWGDPNLFHIIVEENNIKNPGSLAVGTVLKVPADPKQ